MLLVLLLWFLLLPVPLSFCFAHFSVTLGPRAPSTVSRCKIACWPLPVRVTGDGHSGSPFGVGTKQTKENFNG